MFDIGFSEILLIFGLALVVLGPDKLPAWPAPSAAGPAGPARWRASSATSSKRRPMVSRWT